MTSTPERLVVALDHPLTLRTRIVLLVAAACLAASFLAPLWHIGMKAPQYPKGLGLDIYLYKLQGGNNDHDIVEINSLNHYIGMMPINRSELGDLDWMPFAFGFLILVVVRAAVLGNGRDLVDVNFLVAFVAVSAMTRFVYKLYVFGHNLDPHAAFRVEPFMPVILGNKQIANFQTWAYPQWGSAALALAMTLMLLVLVGHFWRSVFPRGLSTP